MSMLVSDHSLIALAVKERLAKAYALRGKDLNQCLRTTQQVLFECEKAGYEEGIAQARIQSVFFI